MIFFLQNNVLVSSMYLTNKTTVYFVLFLECDKGSYGLECNETCGHCRDVNQCSNIDGTCKTGCAAGFEGGSCKTRENKHQGTFSNLF